MDSSRYSRLRDLFLAAEELPADQRESFLESEAGGDHALVREVLDLLSEHDPNAAQQEGDNAAPVPSPPAISSATYTDSTTSTGAFDSPQSEGLINANLMLDSPRKIAQDTATRTGHRDGLKTKRGAIRTHASPKFKDESKSPKSITTLPIWARKARKDRWRASTWLWLAALLPTAIVGYWTYLRVNAAIQGSVRVNLQAAARNLTRTTDRYLTDQVELVQSWSRQPSLLDAIDRLRSKSSDEAPQNSDAKMNKTLTHESSLLAITNSQSKSQAAAEKIQSQLEKLSGNPDIQFVVWSDSYRVIAKSKGIDLTVGQPVKPGQASDVTRALSGQPVVVGPQREWASGRSAESSEPVSAQSITDLDLTVPTISIIVPVFDDQSIAMASLMIKQRGTFTEFNEIFTEFSIASGMDAYAVDDDGTMLSDSLNAKTLATQNRFDLPADHIAANLRVSDPGMLITSENRGDVDRLRSPTTVAVSGARRLETVVSIAPYSNYGGQQVVGSWGWLPQFAMGVIVEQEASIAFAPSKLVQLSYLILGTVLAITGFLAASKIARTSTAQHAAVHPLSRYDLSKELGNGGMGVVYRATHRQLGRDVALKVLRNDRQSNDDRARFDREARLAASLSNPHSVSIYDYGHNADGEAFCVMQFLKGLTLDEVVARSGHQSIGRSLSILRQICDALNEAHSMNLMHRDIKPHNIMLSLDSSLGDWAVVFDYGLAKPLQPDASVYQTSEAIWSGTPMYMAPERFREPGGMDPRSDIYSIGCVAYYLLSGRPPFIESQPDSLFSLILSEQPISIGIHRDETFDADVSQLVFKCMAKTPDDRFESVAQLGRELDLLRVKHPWTVDQAKIWWSHHGGQ